MRQFERILVVKLADIGDAVLSLPAVQSLRAANPNATIDILTTEAGANVFALSKAIDRVITLQKQQFDHIRGLISFSGITELLRLAAQLRGGRYEAVVLLHHLTTSFGARKFAALVRTTGATVVAGLDNGRGAFLTHAAPDYGFGAKAEWEYGLDVVRSLGIDAHETRPEFSLPESAEKSARSLLQRTMGHHAEYAVVHPEVGAFSPARAWRNDHFADVCRHLIVDHDLPVLLVGVERDRPGHEQLAAIPGVYDLVGQTSFPELCHIVQASRIVVGCDSSVCHLAGAFNRPTIALFGPSNIHAWKPYGSRVMKIGERLDRDENVIALHRDLPCSPCIYTGFRLGRPQGCRSRSCMMDLPPAPVQQLSDTLLQRS